MRNVGLVLCVVMGIVGVACGGRLDAPRSHGAPADAEGGTGAPDTGRDLLVMDAGAAATPLHCASGFTRDDFGCARWTPAGKMTGGGIRCETATLLLDGRVLLHGCRTGGPPDDATAAMLYDPAADALQPTPTGPTYRSRTAFTATRLIDGRVLIAGGIDGEDGSVLDEAEIFDPARGTFQETPEWMLCSASHHAAALLGDGRVLLTGGSYTSPPPEAGLNEQEIACAEIFDPRSDTWSPAPPMSTPRSRQAALTLANGSVLVVGGESAVNEWLGTGEVYGVATSRWEPVPTLGNASVYDPQAILLAGGSSLVVWDTGAAVLDVGRSAWSPTGAVGLPNGGLAGLPGGRVLAISTDCYALHVNGSSVYDPATNSWARTVAPAGWHCGTPATALRDGRVFALGGAEPGYGAEIYTWIAASP
jgi:hypothetical protein